MSKKKSKLPSEKETQQEQVRVQTTATALPLEVINRDNSLYYYLGLAAILVLIYFIRKNFLDIPFERDEGSYMYCGNSILHGAIPFKDIGSQRLDGVFYFYALLVGIFGYTVKSMHFAFILINMLTAVLLFFVTKKLANQLAGLAAALFFALMSMNAFASGFTIQSEHIVSLFIAGAFLSLVHFLDDKKIVLLVISGVLFSLAFQVKQTAALYGIIAGIVLVLKQFLDDKKNIKKILLHALVFAVAVFIPIAIDLLVIYQKGAWSDFMLWFFDIRKQYLSATTFEDGMTYFKMGFTSVSTNYMFFWIVSLLGMLTVFITHLPVWKKIFVFGIQLAGFLTIVPGLHFYGHYFLAWIPAAAISGGMFIYSIQDYVERKLNMKKAGLAAALAFTLIPAFANLSTLSEYYFAPNHLQIMRDVYGSNPFPESKDIADKLNSLMKKEDKLAVLGTEIEMYVYTNKVSPSRFAGSGALLEFPVKQSKEWQQEFMRDVEKAAPKYMVFYGHAISWMVHPKAENLIFPWFDKFVKEHYNLYGYADILPEGTRYVWSPDPALLTQQPKSQYKVFVFERK